MERDFKLKGMVSEGAKDDVEHMLMQIDGVESVKVDFKDKKVKVKYDESVLPTAHLESSLTSFGYQVLNDSRIR